jgi:hypothetical protein
MRNAYRGATAAWKGHCAAAAVWKGHGGGGDSEGRQRGGNDDERKRRGGERGRRRGGERGWIERVKMRRGRIEWSAERKGYVSYGKSN